MIFISHDDKFTNSMKDYAENKFSKVIPYLSKEAYDKIEIRFSMEGDLKKVEASVNYEAIKIRVSEIGDDYYSLIDILEDQFIRKIRKYKTAIENREKNNVNKFLSSISEQDEETNEEEDLNISKEKFLIPDLESTEEAICSMNELGHDFYIYKDIDTNDFTVIYRRKRGDYGKIVCK